MNLFSFVWKHKFYNAVVTSLNIWSAQLNVTGIRILAVESLSCFSSLPAIIKFFGSTQMILNEFHCTWLPWRWSFVSFFVCICVVFFGGFYKILMNDIMLFLILSSMFLYKDRNKSKSLPHHATIWPNFGNSGWWFRYFFSLSGQVIVNCPSYLVVKMGQAKNLMSSHF